MKPEASADGLWLFYPSPAQDQGVVFNVEDAPDLLDAFLSIRTLTEAAAFTARFGPVGWSLLDTDAWFVDAPWPAWLRRPFGVVDSVPWIVGHAEMLHWCQDVWRRVSAGEEPTLAECAPPASTAAAVPWVSELLSDAEAWQVLAAPVSARETLFSVLNSFVKEVRCVVQQAPVSTAVRVGYQGRALIDTLYWLLAQRLESADGFFRRCEACGRTFFATHARRRFCPGPAAESSCAKRIQAKQRRRQMWAAGKTSRGQAPQRASARRAREATSGGEKDR